MNNVIEQTPAFSYASRKEIPLHTNASTWRWNLFPDSGSSMQDKATENSAMSAAGSGASLLAHLSSARNSLAMKGFVCMC